MSLTLPSGNYNMQMWISKALSSTRRLPAHCQAWMLICHSNHSCLCDGPVGCTLNQPSYIHAQLKEPEGWRWSWFPVLFLSKLLGTINQHSESSSCYFSSFSLINKYLFRLIPRNDWDCYDKNEVCLHVVGDIWLLFFKWKVEFDYSYHVNHVNIIKL